MQSTHNKATFGITLAALGVVYGDIGTSPLYTLKECFNIGALPLQPANILGILSLVFWAILLVVTCKYVMLVLRADKKGEGGIMVLMAQSWAYLSRKSRRKAMLLGLIGASLFYGDAIITPAMSVLSAAEGLKLVSPTLDPYVLPLALVILIALFLIQKHGTASVGKLFGPIIVVWFTVLGLWGTLAIVQRPEVLLAANPWYAINFLLTHGWAAFLPLGAVVLALTGAEALYADMGHFGRKPIEIAWLGLVMPGLLLNYFGQGALLLANPSAIENPFYLLAPKWGLLPMIGLATAATIIASQAVISGAYSLSQQAIQLGFSPRMSIQHTSDREIGQIYMPFVNWALLAAVIVVIVGFKSSANLAAAYGIAVTGTMVITTMLLYVVMRLNWRWPLWLAGSVTALFLCIDLVFFSSNLLKVAHGGWLPLLIGIVILVLFLTWKRGRELLMQRLDEQAIPLESFIENMEVSSPTRVPGTAVFMTSSSHGVPHALLHNLKHNKVLHDRIVLLTVRTREEPFVAPADRLAVKRLSASFWQVIAEYGYKETPNVNELLELAEVHGLAFEVMDTSFFLSRESLISTERPGMARWREKLFVWMSKNALKATDFFQIPANRVVELGSQIEL
ncbi:potassium transporter Kup [Crenobacter caeni]|uniref:Probable potassium transport system protein Kup n=1 Tax=Crenobacter caeni TaxID=2705474 RepID=A0A6B2KSN2_9NEIS|nr:potassium transporter Kup [Crenobacter caeni]NDV13256.1 potassium transporter Kup [Crenobacter caeni]